MNRGFFQFARDIVISNETGSLYTAPFKWEQYLAESTLDGFSESHYHSRLIVGLRNVKLPILANLSPEVIVEIHKDSEIINFRVSLGEMLKNVDGEIGSNEIKNQITKMEKGILQLKVEVIQKEIKSSKFLKINQICRRRCFHIRAKFHGWSSC